MLPGEANKAALEIPSDVQFLEEQTRHDSLSCAGVVRQDEP
jgi:hypothetical protein